jgi:signal transduction histidine kinase
VGTGLRVEQIREKNARVDWPVFVKIMANAGGVWSPDELVQIGSSWFESPFMRPFSIVARLLFTATDFYKWLFVKAMGVGNQTFSCVEATLEEPRPGLLVLEMKVPDPFEVAREFFLLSKGTFAGMPRVLGLPRANVELEWLPRGARYRVEVPEGGGLLGRFKRALTWPFTVRAAAQELKEAHESLQSRYGELERAQRTLASQAEQLATVNELGRELTQHAELSEYGEALAKLLNDRFLCTGVLLTSLNEGADELTVFESGTRQGETKRFPLVTAGQRIGGLEVWGLARQANSDPDAKLLQDLVPWFSIALENARSFSKLREYQAQLERRVEQRTADLRKTTQQLAEALELQKDIDRQKTEFFANASHELRTPLTLLVAPLETLSNSDMLPEPARLELASAMRNGYRLIKLVNDLLDISKIEAGKLNLRMGPTDLSRLIDETVRPWRPALQKRGVRLEVDAPKSLPLVADAERLEQVMLNLFSNAVKHTPDEGEIRVSAARSGEGLRLTIQNSGEGIDPDDVPRIFERFGQSMHSRGRRFGSTGLGLAVVREIVQLHGGTVQLDNLPGVSAAFVVNLPLGAEPDEAALSSVPSPSRMELAQYQATATVESLPSAPATPANGLPSSYRPLLLLVEDNSDLRAFLVRGLSAEYEILQAVNGVEGLDTALQRMPNVILSDVMMPEMDGLEMCRRIKAHPQGAGIPLVLLTARSDLEVKLSGLEGGADDFVVKPFHLEEVKARLRTQLRLRQLTAKLTRAEKLVAIGTLVGGVAHEVRNPLNGIINALRPLKEMIPPNDSSQELLDTAIEAAERVENISSQLLEQVRAGEGAHGPVNISDNIRFAVRMLAHKTKQGPSVKYDAPEDLTVVGESGALNQIWINLIDNAILAAGPSGKVTVTAHGEGRSAVIEVSDDGPGIPAQVLPRIFDPFFTTRDVGKGTGLGLAVVREIVDRHGGTIAVDSVRGAGARFKVTLPSASGGEVHGSG